MKPPEKTSLITCVHANTLHPEVPRCPAANQECCQKQSKVFGLWIGNLRQKCFPTGCSPTHAGWYLWGELPAPEAALICPKISSWTGWQCRSCCWANSRYTPGEELKPSPLVQGNSQLAPEPLEHDNCLGKMQIYQNGLWGGSREEKAPRSVEVAVL